ncbi:uncharacterized protein [Rutidosis leptorrhynchoides]|uniref:uncharacterized protein n=1 Tax=Rutidosis leptorrhynchoides TaxID=125765 RepID=UPI003A993702
MRVTPLNQLTKERDNYKIEVKVHNVWKKFYYSNASVPSSLEMVLIDREGNKIRAEIEKDGIRYFEATFKEGRFLYLSRFNVTGRVINIIKFRTIKEKNVERKSLEFELLNHSGERIRCALWGEHAIRLLALAKEYQEANTPIIALIYNCKLNNWDEGPQVNNFIFETKVYLNEPLSHINLHNDLFHNNPNHAELSQILTISKDFKEGVSDLLSKFTDAKPVCVADIVKLPKDVSFVVCGTMTRVFDTDGWFQQYCCKCDKKLVDTYNVELEKSVLWCLKCSAEMQWIPKI